jgi:hypothetical protein
MVANILDAFAASDGLVVNGVAFDAELPLERYEVAFGRPSRTIAASPPAPYGHRNNQVHLYDDDGIYLTEHHASRLIQSVNFIFNPGDSPFPIEAAFRGKLSVGGRQYRPDMTEADLDLKLLSRDLAGNYSVRFKGCWVGVSLKGRRNARGKRQRPRYLVCVSVCF